MESSTEHNTGTPPGASGAPGKKSLHMVTCGSCQTKVFISADLPPLATTPCTKCGAPIMMPMMLRHFELRAHIGSGGMGKVYRAWDTVLQRMVAIKLMRPEVATQPGMVDSFYREARVMASFNHTNIVHIYTYDEWDDQRFLVMEVADRGSLDTKIEALHRLSELEVLDIGIRIASALDLALKHNMLHRDIKPGNILFNADNEPKLVDFGLARSTEAEDDANEGTWGTPYYVAPEKILREKETFLSDMYSLAGTLYHAITGHVPFEAPTVQDLVMAHVQTPLTAPNQVVPEITQPTSDGLAKAMAKNPADRFLSYEEFRMVLEAARSQLLVQLFNQPSSAEETPKNPKSRTSWWRR